MALTFNQVVTAVALAIIILALIRVYQRNLAARHRRALAAGTPFSFGAFLRGDVSPYPRRFRMGWVTIGYGVPTWKARSLLPRRIDLPTSAVVKEIRQLTFLENVTLNEDCRVLVAAAGDVKLELAVLTSEVVTALTALEGSTGGAWTVEEHAPD